MITLQERILAAGGADTAYIPETVEKMRKANDLYLFGTGVRAIHLANFLKHQKVKVGGGIGK